MKQRVLQPIFYALLLTAIGADRLPAQPANPETGPVLAAAGGATNAEPAVGQTDQVVEQATDNPSAESSQRHAVDRVAVLNQLTVQAGETVHDAVVVGGLADINGTVEGDLVMVMSKGALGPQAMVKGDLVVVGSRVDKDATATIDGESVLVGATGTNLLRSPWMKRPQEWVAHGLFYGRPLPPQHAWVWVVAALSILLYALTALLFPRQVRSFTESLDNQPGRSFLFGLLACLLLLPVLILLAITGIGLVLVPFVICVAVVAYFLGKTAVYAYTGQRLGALVPAVQLPHPLGTLLLGALLFCLLYTIPLVGLLVWLMVLPLGIGAVVQTLAASAAKRANGARGEAMVEPVTFPSPIPGEPATALVQLPRAGFWVRVLATLLDLVLVGIICSVFGREKWFLLLWMLYHVGFWAWKGTTVGGILAGLKILRTDGTPLSFGAALIRSLASFFSFFLLGVGFFWVGWTADKLSWHDKIADTVMVKLPKGMSAVR